MERAEDEEFDDARADILEDLSLCNITSLPVEILLQIFETLDTKSLISLSRVCQLFHHLSSKVLQKKFDSFIYDYAEFKFFLNLDDAEILDLCILCGPGVTRLRFSPGLNDFGRKDLILKERLFKQNLHYFPNLLELVIEGKFAQDDTFLELGEKCKQLKSIRIINCDDSWPWVDDVADLEGLERVELKCCREFIPDDIKMLSQKRQLKGVSIVECRLSHDVPIMLELCQHWQHLQTLRLTGFTNDPVFLRAILALPSLQCLQFFWVNRVLPQFEENFFKELKENPQKSKSLKCLKFENERPCVEDESIQRKYEKAYAVISKYVCVNDRMWIWKDETFRNISTALQTFTQLESLSFRYCRLLDYHQLLQLPEIIGSLSLITINGCPKAEDERFLNRWMNGRLRENCQLKFESIFSIDEVKDLLRFQEPYTDDVVVRSIECKFSVES